MLRTLLHVVLQIGIAAARIAIMVAAAVLTLAGRALAAACGALWRSWRSSSPAGPARAAPAPDAPPEPRAAVHRPRPFRF